MGIEPLFNSLPNHWESTTLGEACKRGGGDIQTGPFGSQLHASDYVPVGIPSIMPKNIGENRVDITDIARIRPEDAQRLNRYLVKAGDIVYSRRGDVERRALIRDEEEGWLCGTGCLRVRLGEEIADPLYASYYLGHPVVRQWIVRHAVGATMPNLNTSILASLPFVLPPLDEQKAIAHILGTLDDKIELNQQMNRTLEAIARTLFKSWFIDFDPVRAKLDGRQPAGMDAETAALFPAEFEDSAIGTIPKGWKVQKLVEITSKIGSGATPRGGSQVYVEEGIALIRSQNVYDHQFSWDGLARITEETAESLRNVVVEANDILLNITGDSILRTCVVEPEALPARVNQHVAIIRAIPEIPCRYLHLYLVQPQMKSFLLGFDTGGTRKAVTKGQLESVPIPVPPESILLRFKEITDSLHERINSNLIESRTITSTRDALLPKLLSGKVRIPLTLDLPSEVEPTHA